MGKTIELTIDNFSGGMTGNIRSKDMRLSRVIKHLDPLSHQGQLLPLRDMAADGSTGDTEKLCQYLVARKINSAVASDVWALGVVSGQTYAKIFRRTDVSDAWAAAHATLAQDTVERSEKLFVEYNNVLYGANTNNIWSYDIATNTFTSAAQALTYTNIAQGIVHSKDDILYIPYDNKIASKNGAGAFNLTALALPANLIITSICEYGNYLAIATKPLVRSGIVHSTVYLWDRDSTLATLSEKIDWGAETLLLIEEIDGSLVGISAIGVGTGASGVDYSAWNFTPKVIFRVWNGIRATKFLELPALSSTTLNITGKQKIHNRLYFMMTIKMGGLRFNDDTDGVQLNGVWALGRNESGQFCLYLDRLLNNDTAITTAVPKGFLLFGDYMLVAYTTAGTYVANITNSSDVYAAASGTYESLILGESYRHFKLNAIGISTEPMPMAGQVILKYKADAETSWTTIFTHTADDALFHEAINIESSPGVLPQFREIQFQFLVTGKAVVTGLWIQAKEIEDGLVARLLRSLIGWLG
ncbi:MAG: hypothetical protein UT82_C0018G0019 [Parcubacteria group bacterium GW2011_GWB1_40_14]|nr:MAG: hypothetical protein UT82_C0018G0019 [Parcubacteria group bacterium GW2011_GWB1_40_14]